MSYKYHSLSTIWSQFPIEFETSSFNNDIKSWKAKFENRAYCHENYKTNIIMIGNVSTGKSTLINTFLGQEYVGGQEGHGTRAFFYCSLSEKDYEYYTLNNSNEEKRDMSALKNASYFDEDRIEDINENTIIRFYVKNDKSGILEDNTVIVDCPGFRQKLEYQNEIEKHCSNADLFIFMFHINESATEKQIKYIKEIRKKYNKPTCFFVYNKCDLPDFNDELKTELIRELYDLFGEQYERELIANHDPLYFISATKPVRFSDFSRLKEDIIKYKHTNSFRSANFQSKIPEEVNKFCRRLNNFISDEKKKRTLLSATINKFEIQMEKNSSQIWNYVERCIDECKNNYYLDKIFDIINRVIDDYKEKCSKGNASKMIGAIEETCSVKAIEFIQNDLINSCIDPINKIITQINTDNINGIIIDTETGLYISRDLLVIPICKNIENIFWIFEFGNKTKKIKEHYATFIESVGNKEIIRSSIKNVYEKEFSNIRRNYEYILENYKRKCIKNVDELKEKLRNLESDREKLATYEIAVKENLEKFRTFSNN